jgi:hypothetical protein
VINKYQGNDYYQCLVERIVDLPLTEKLRMISHIDERLFEARVFFVHMVKAYTAKYVESGQEELFDDCIDLLNSMGMPEGDKIKILFSWMRTFLYCKKIDKFLDLYESLEEEVESIECDLYEFYTYKLFFNSIIQYTERGILDLDRFKEECRRFQDDNEYSGIDVKDVASLF